MATQRIVEFLDGNHARYVRLSHSPAYTAQEVAGSMHLPGKYMAKTVIVRIDGKLAMVVVPAPKDVDLELLRQQAGTNDIVLADEAEFVDRFRGCQLGTAPPFGNLFGIETFVDHEVARQDQIVFNAGTHTDAILMSFADYRRLAHPHLVRVAVNPTEFHPQFVQI